jgi:hypothetical protein
MASDLNTNLLTIMKDNLFSKLNNFLKHDPFACKLTQVDFLFMTKKFTMKKFKKIPKKSE